MGHSLYFQFPIPTMAFSIQNTIFEQKLMGKSKIEISRYSVMVQTSGNNNLRIASSNLNLVSELNEWYQQLTNQKGDIDKNSKYTNVVILCNARKDKVFGREWMQILTDYMLSLEFKLVGDGSCFNINGMREIQSLMFLSPISKK